MSQAIKSVKSNEATDATADEAEVAEANKTNGLHKIDEANVFVKAVGVSVLGDVCRAKEADADKANKEQ